MAQISKRMVKAWERFNDDLQAFIKETEPENGCATLYEDANTTRYVKGFVIGENGRLDWYEEDWDGRGDFETWYLSDDEEARDYLSFWRACLRRAKRYWQMDAIELERLQNCETEDEED